LPLARAILSPRRKATLEKWPRIPVALKNQQP
jgi:hypothetical protein